MIRGQVTTTILEKNKQKHTNHTKYKHIHIIDLPLTGPMRVAGLRGSVQFIKNVYTRK